MLAGRLRERPQPLARDAAVEAARAYNSRHVVWPIGAGICVPAHDFALSGGIEQYQQLAALDPTNALADDVDGDDEATADAPSAAAAATASASAGGAGSASMHELQRGAGVTGGIHASISAATRAHGAAALSSALARDVMAVDS